MLVGVRVGVCVGVRVSVGVGVTVRVAVGDGVRYSDCHASTYVSNTSSSTASIPSLFSLTVTAYSILTEMPSPSLKVLMTVLYTRASRTMKLTRSRMKQVSPGLNLYSISNIMRPRCGFVARQQLQPAFRTGHVPDIQCFQSKKVL